MPSSGQGGHWNGDFTQCMRKGFHAHVQRLEPTAQGLSPALVVGEAVHIYAQSLYECQLLGAPKDSCMGEAVVAFNNFLDEQEVEWALDDPYLEERVKLARQVLPVWAEGQLARLEAGVERTIAVEVSFSYKLPAETPYGPIAEHLRLVTGRIDRVFKRNDPLALDRLDSVGLTVQDHKATKASSLTYYVRDLLRSDQHLEYVFGWNLAPICGVWQGHSRGAAQAEVIAEGLGITDYILDIRGDDKQITWEKADEIEYNLIRLGTLSPKSLHRESRPTNTEQLLNY